MLIIYIYIYIYIDTIYVYMFNQPMLPYINHQSFQPRDVAKASS